MKSLRFLFAGLLATTTAFAQTDIPAVNNVGPMGNGSWIRFLSGGDRTSIQENWGLNLNGSAQTPVKISNASLLVGYPSNGSSYGTGNAYVSGQVGIGTTSPSAKLDIAGDLGMGGFASLSSFRSASNNYTNFFAGGGLRYNNNGTYTVLTDGGSNYFAAIRMDADGGNQGAVSFYTGATVGGNSYNISHADLYNYRRMTLVGERVGIGTANPQSLTEIRKNLAKGQGPVLELTNGGGGEGATSELFFSTYQRDGASPSARIKVADNGDWGGDMYFDTKGPDGNAPLSTRMFIDGANGNVAIGTTDPKGYKLAVAGNIRATEIKVEAYPWPDYVFKPTYKLPSLSEVKEYIDKYKHLPDMPSEQDVAKEGISLGQMNQILVKKMEEMTLYMIEKDKEIQSLKKAVGRLSKFNQKAK